jgi:hypothetical protein
MRFVYHGPESSHDARYIYHWEVLRTALELTTKKYGDFQLVMAPTMTEDRQMTEMKKSSPSLTVMIRETNAEYEKILTPVRIPIDRNLIGYRVLMIDKKTQASLLKVKTSDDLKPFPMGQGAGWGDVAILENAGFQVKTEVRYDDLFKSLSFGKFQLFPRGVVEVLEEFRQFKNLYPNLAIESKIMIYYPLPTYFWFHNTESGRKMAQRVDEGMRLMIRSGSLQKIFDKHYTKIIRELDLKSRMVIKIPNPFLPATVPFDKPELWYNPVN